MEQREAATARNEVTEEAEASAELRNARPDASAAGNGQILNRPYLLHNISRPACIRFKNIHRIQKRAAVTVRRLRQIKALLQKAAFYLIMLCGHYKGIDERIREHLVTKEISIGDYVLSGGELAAAVLTDSLVRLIPGALSDETSALSDSFQDGMVSPPVYTRPREYKGWEVPDVLLSGNDKIIDEWKYQQALERTKIRRPEMYEKIKK